MKLRFDHNISPELIARLADLFPASNHVYPLNLHRAYLQTTVSCSHRALPRSSRSWRRRRARAKLRRASLTISVFVLPAETSIAAARASSSKLRVVRMYAQPSMSCAIFVCAACSAAAAHQGCGAPPTTIGNGSRSRRTKSSTSPSDSSVTAPSRVASPGSPKITGAAPSWSL